MWKRCQIYTHTQHALISGSFGVVKFCSLRGEGRLKNGVRMKSYDYIRLDWILFLLTYDILVIYNCFADTFFYKVIFYKYSNVVRQNVTV